MLKIGDKEYRNLQEQVEKNMQDIKFILEEEGVLNEFGITVIGQEETIAGLPAIDEDEFIELPYGAAYAIGEEPPYTLYIKTRANGTHPTDYWFDIGQFPMPGPTGQDGEDGKSIAYATSNISHTIGYAKRTSPAVYPMVTQVGDLVVDSAGYLGECTTLTENVIEIVTKAFIGGAPGQNGNNIRYYSGNLDTVVDNYTQVSEDYSVGDVVVSSNGYLGTVTSKSTSYVMVQTKASLVGPQGAPGTSDKGLYITSVEPTEDGGVYTISSGNLDNVNANVTIQANDIIIYIDSNDEPTYMYQVTSISGTTITVQPVAAYAKGGGGSQEYIHNIFMYVTGNNGGGFYGFAFKNNVSTAYTSYTDIITAMNALGIINTGDYYGAGVPCSGESRISNVYYKTISMATNTDGNCFYVDCVGNGQPFLRRIPGSYQGDATIEYIKDIVI